MKSAHVQHHNTRIKWKLNYRWHEKWDKQNTTYRQHYPCVILEDFFKCLCFVLLFIRKLCLVLSGSCHLLLEIKHFRCSFSLQLCGGSRPWTKGGGEKGGFVFVAQPAFLLLVISSFFKSGEAQDTGPSPRFDIGAISEIEQNLPPSINFANSPWPETFF